MNKTFPTHMLHHSCVTSLMCYITHVLHHSCVTSLMCYITHMLHHSFFHCYTTHPFIVSPLSRNKENLCISSLRTHNSVHTLPRVSFLSILTQRMDSVRLHLFQALHPSLCQWIVEFVYNSARFLQRL